jgi:succinoglycan biosynthesis protein ExoW
MTRVGVVIPYFQRETGLLTRAVQSVLAQTAPDVALVIVIVDDASPHPAEDELATVDAGSRHQIIILQQDNAGPGAARNRGLDRLAREEVEYVAFLDSDDHWAPDHIGSALAALRDDADLVFDNHDRQQYGDEQSYFAAHGRLTRWLGGGDQAYLRPAGGELYDCEPRWLTLFFLNEFPAQTSTVVFRNTAALARVRFDPSFRSLGEDLLFFLEIGREARAVHCSSAVGVHCGAGVSIFHSALSWDHPDAPMRFANSLLLWSTVARRVARTPEERALADDRVRGFRRGYLFIALRSAIRQRRVHRPAIALVTRHGLVRWQHLPAALLGLATRAARSAPLFPEH